MGFKCKHALVAFALLYIMTFKHYFQGNNLVCTALSATPSPSVQRELSLSPSICNREPLRTHQSWGSHVDLLGGSLADPAYNNAAESLGWIRVDCDMPNAWKNARTGRCWKYTTQWSQVPCSTPGAVEREGVCRINNEKTAEGQPVPLSEYEQRWASFFQVELGRAGAHPSYTSAVLYYTVLLCT